MSDNYFKTGLENLKKIDGTAGSNVIENLSDIAPDLARYIIEFAFGQIYERPGLSLQERELLTLSSLLTAGGCEAQLQVHGTCIDECPVEAISEGDKYSINPDLCTECGTCADACPSEAIHLG